MASASRLRIRAEGDLVQDANEPRHETARWRSGGRGPSRLRLTPGELIPATAYRVIRWLGDGGMGVVYEAEHTEIGRHVALKILHPELSRDPAVSIAFREEARAASRIGSPYIVEVLDFVVLPDGRLMFVMELLSGASLLDLVRMHPVPADRLLGILRQACKGLGAAHKAGIVHRDVKPENVILVERDGKPDVVKILDFGVAHVLHGSTDSDDHSSGTPPYMAPEEIAGYGIDGRVDMYALACTAYEMVSGTPPFCAPDMDDVLNMHLLVDPVPLSQIVDPEVLPAPIERVIMRCLAKRPEDRYHDMADLEAALCEAQVELGLRTAFDELPLPAEIDPIRRETLLRRMPTIEGPTRRRWVWPAVALASSVLTLMLAFTLWRLATAEPAVLPLVDTLTIDARAAAARSYFVYPPLDEPEQRAAYTFVLELEHQEHEPATARATELRQEFGKTLTRLGDYYWSQEGGQPFAIDYYAQALVFQSELEHARERASLSPGELASLRMKASSGQFTQAELAAVEPLAVLADPDQERRAAGLRELLGKPSRRSNSTHARLEQMLERSSVEGVETHHEARKRAVVASAEARASTPSLEQVPEPSATARVNDPAKTSTLVREGLAALHRGEIDSAEKWFHRALASDPTHVRALQGLSDTYFERGAHAKAAALAERAAALSQHDAGLRIRLGDAYFKLMRYRDAMAQYERAKRLGHKDATGRIEKLRGKLGE